MNKKERVVIGISGGVDSAVSAMLLKEQGYDVLAVFMKNWEEQDPDGICTAEEDYDYVRRACDKIGIDYYTVNFTQEYWDRVFAYFLEEYKAGRTPNPDVMCNKEIKFKEFLQFAWKMDADHLATGHYARIDYRDGKFQLLKAADRGKDQTYFLHTLGQHQLERTMFPIGDLQKSEVRELARQADLPNAARKDSTGICFIGERNFRTFLKQYLPAMPGNIVMMDGQVIGKHDGLMYYTLGQRKGLGIGGRPGTGEPWFVVEKRMDANELVVAQGDDAALYSNACIVNEVSWISGEEPNLPMACNAKLRYRQQDQGVRIEKVKGGLLVLFDKPQRAVTPGQSAVFYNGEVCLGGGVIDSAMSELK